MSKEIKLLQVTHENLWPVGFWPMDLGDLWEKNFADPGIIWALKYLWVRVQVTWGCTHAQPYWHSLKNWGGWRLHWFAREMPSIKVSSHATHHEELQVVDPTTLRNCRLDRHCILLYCTYFFQEYVLVDGNVGGRRRVIWRLMMGVMHG